MFKFLKDDNEIIFYGATAAIPTLLSYINLKGKLSKINVIDGDIFKQSQYISGLNKKIEEFDHYSSKLDKFVEV